VQYDCAISNARPETGWNDPIGPPHGGMRIVELRDHHLHCI
jgi:hypothetical protein